MLKAGHAFPNYATLHRYIFDFQAYRQLSLLNKKKNTIIAELASLQHTFKWITDTFVQVPVLVSPVETGPLHPAER